VQLQALSSWWAPAKLGPLRRTPQRRFREWSVELKALRVQASLLARVLHFAQAVATPELPRRTPARFSRLALWRPWRNESSFSSEIRMRFSRNRFVPEL